MSRQRIGTLTLPSPPERYDPRNEAQFRAAVERAVTEAVSRALNLIPTYDDSTRPTAGRQDPMVIFNSDDGNLNIDDGTQWILPDGTAT